MTSPVGPEAGPAAPSSGFAPSLGRVGPYEIMELLGQGGMAAVYRAQHSRGGPEVALKVLARMRPSWVQRFSREFDAARRCNHPNVVRVLEAGESEGLAYYSMERIAGVTASRYVLGLDGTAPLPPAPPEDPSATPMPIDELILQRSVDVAVQLARAVGAIHSVGLVHRDLKPGNVLVTSAGIVKLVDFGVAKWLEEQTSFTQVGHVVGSYSYMSPEQITGSEVDHRADLYGMGVLLYELLTGAPPFRARRPQEYLWLHCTAQPEPVSRRVSGVPAALDSLLLRMLAKEPADRPDSMKAVELELMTIQAQLDGASVSATMEPLSEGPPGRQTGDVVLEFEDEAGDLRFFDEPGDDDAEDWSYDPQADVELKGRNDTAGAGSSSTSSAPRTPRAAPKKAASAAVAALVTPKHVGRKAELELLLNQLRTIRTHGVHGVLVEGEEGVGKTRLLHTFRGLAWVKGARVAIGRCHASGGAFCAPFHDILLRLAGPGLARSHHDRVLGPEKELLTRFFPVLASRDRRPPPAASRVIGADADERAAVVRAVGAAFRRAAEDAPLVLGIEDIQWADEGTVRLVSSLLRRLAQPNPAKVLLVLTWRAEDSGGGAGQGGPPLATDVADLPNVKSITLSPLSDEETAELIRSVTVDVEVADSVIRDVARAARGNPRFAVEVARTLVDVGGSEAGDEWDIPTSLLGAFRRRLDSLSKPARDVARVIALLGGSPPLEIVATGASLDEAAFARAIDELERRRVIEVDHRDASDTASLHSEALRAAVLDSVSSNQARALHRRAAVAWLKLGGDQTEASAQAARHLYAAGDAQAAFPHALEAAYRAGEALDYTQARRWMAQIGDPGEALDRISPEANYRYHMLRFLLAFGDGELDAAEQAVARAIRAATTAQARLSTGVSCARLHTRTGNYLGAVQVCRKGLREALKDGFPDLAVLFAIQGSRAARRSGDNESALAWLSEADLQLAAHPELEPLSVRAAWTRSAVLLELRREAEAEDAIHQAIELAIRHHQERAEAGLRTNLSVIYWRRGDIEGAVGEVERSIRIFDEMGERDQVALNESNMAELRLLQGRVAEAMPFAKSCWKTFRRLRDRQGIIVSAATLLAAARAKQAVHVAEEVIDAVGDTAGTGQQLEALWTQYWIERSRWHVSRRQKKLAWGCVEQATRALGPAPAEYRKREVELLRAELHYLDGEADSALPFAERVLAGAEAEQHWPVSWMARAIITACKAKLGQPEPPEPPPDDQVRHNVPLALATAWYHGETFSSMGKLKAAISLWDEGLEVARKHGFADWKRRFTRSLKKAREALAG